MSDRVNINVGAGEQIKPDGAYLNDLANAKSREDLERAARDLGERARGVTYDPSSGQYRAAAPAASATETREVTKTVEIGGREFTFTASSEAEMAALVSNAQLVAENVTAPARGEDGRFTRNDSADDEAERQQKIYNDSQNELAFRRGEITVREYLEKTGAISEFLEGQGVSIADLQATAQQRDAEAYAQDWQQATQTFLAGPGGEWPGGEANKINLQNALISLGLMDAEDKVGALVEAFDYMKRNNALIPYEQTTPAISAAVDKAINEASPEEILDAWKTSQQGAGFSAAEANKRFIESFRRKG